MLEPTIVYTDSDFLVINKPAGLLVHATKYSANTPTLTEWIVRHYPEIASVGEEPEIRPGLVHRLDQGTSGVMIVARNQHSFEYLKSLFQKHLIHKTYLALVFGKLKEREGIIQKPIAVGRGTLKRSVTGERMMKDAITRYRVKTIFELSSGLPAQAGNPKWFSLLEASPETGRTHQIRVHLASMGHPLVGDTLYGPRRQPPWAERLMLHALSLRFLLASGATFQAAADPPPDYQKTIAALSSLAHITYPHQEPN